MNVQEETTGNILCIMARENEIKISLKISMDDFIERIGREGYKFDGKLNQTDIYFERNDWFLYENISALRLRQVDGNDHSFAFKKVFCLRSGEFYIEEIEEKFPLSNISKLKNIFARLDLPFNNNHLKDRQSITKYLSGFGYFDEQVINKTRIVYKKDRDEIVIDNVEDVGIIVELECNLNDPLKKVNEILSEKEWERSLEGTSYIWLKNVKGLTSHINNLKKFKTKPDWNVWENERNIYSQINRK